MNAITKEEVVEIDQRQRGLYHKFDVKRTDGSSAPGEKHHGDEYFVLNLTTDKHAIPALKAYAKSCEKEYPALSSDIRAKIRGALPSEFITVPETTLPNGTVIPSFQVSRFMCTVDDDCHATVQADAAPTVEISYYDAVKACEASGTKLIRETQALALAWNVYNVDGNWTGGKVGEGDLFQGLHNGTVEEAQSNDFEPDDDDERRYFFLSNGERIYDVAGHLFTWVFDDVQGDEKGIIASEFADDTPSIKTCPHGSMERGTGWRPSVGSNWSGHALVRGGCWYSGDLAGVFRLGYYRPGYERDYIGFRSTK